MELKAIHAKWLADELIKRGHELDSKPTNRKLRHYKVYMFVETIALNDDITAITQEKRKLRGLAV